MTLKLEASRRSTTGRHVNQLRREGLVPGVVYGHKVAPIMVEVPAKELAKTVHMVGKSHLLQLKVAGERRQRPVLIKELQLNPRSSAAVHVDFFQVNLEEKLTVQVQVVLAGESPAVKFNVGELLHVVHSLEVSCLPDAIPGEISVDISGLAEVDDAVRLSDIALPDGVELNAAIDPAEILVKIAQARVAAEEPVAEVAASPEEPEVATPE
ncbi:MAG: 50S ribosomal protein L25 [Candidatus Dormibacteria bacterium]|jgi:large subunit ribosomal protein L25